MIIRLVNLRVAAEKQAELAEVMATSHPQVRAVPGCQGIHILQDVADPTHYVTWSAWDSAADLEAYRTSAVYAAVWPRIRACLAERATAQTFEVQA